MTIAAKLAAALTSVFLFAGVPAEATTPDTKPAAPAQGVCKTKPAPDKPAPGKPASGPAVGGLLGGMIPNTAAPPCPPEKPAKPAPKP